MDKQEVFDMVATHLLAQGKRSLVRGNNHPQCVYRTRRGLTCAVGCLIPAVDYRPELEGRSVRGVGQTIGGERGKALIEHETMLVRLQCIHDLKAPRQWRKALLECADVHGLSAAAVSP